MAIAIERRFGFAAVALLIVLVGAAIFPRSLITLVAVPEATPYDIAPASLALQTQIVAFVLAAVVILIGRGRLKFAGALVVFAILLTGAMFTSWGGGTIPQWSGYFVLMGAVLAYGVGSAIGREVFSSSDLARFFLLVILAVLLLQFAVALLQLLGVSLPTGLVNSDRTLEQTVGRVSGTIGHPANLSKVTFVLMLLSLPFTAAGDRKIRRLAFVCVALAALLGGLTVSRANLVAMFVLLTAWILTFPGRARVGTRAVGAIGLVGATAVFAPLVLDRFEDDAEGGLRPLLLDAALRHLSNDVWIGTGPNAYVAVVGQSDAATASGYPVHNGFLLLTAELGWLLAALFFVPLAVLVGWGFRRLRRSSEFLHVPRVIVYATPGVAVIFLTGWGMISVLIIGLWMFALGFLGAARGGVSLTSVGDSELRHNTSRSYETDSAR
ncbi:O-antigen ligase family protein [Microbacterium oleivorans]|uniref:O-antigen ligase-related domain-containing protein n=1 Tax=Microbacterium oleivorans TaxID=273677 RepID=A0A7D5JDT7_9MICO|nr:hypothetical protein [Microbacterium oleivorans]QLD12260.1 hypothetical protein HW566_11040 [Microbacterium oleivorans]